MFNLIALFIEHHLCFPAGKLASSYAVIWSFLISTQVLLADMINQIKRKKQVENPNFELHKVPV